jgi:AcrR family transcriptional regulator
MSDDARVPQQRGEPVREKILATADALFYREGVRAIGIDTIVAEAGIAKTSLYRWFKSKDELIAAFLERRNDQFWAQWDKVAKKHQAAPREALLAHLDWIGRYVMSREYRGCPFLNTTAAFPDIGHPARAVCAKNKRRVHQELLALTEAAGAPDPALLAAQLMLLVEGAFANAPVLGKESPARGLAVAGRAIVEGALA